MLFLTCTTISSVDLAQYGVSLAKDWVAVECGTRLIIMHNEQDSLDLKLITDRPKAVFSLRFHLFYVWCCSSFKCYNFNASVCPFYLIQLR